MLGLVHVAYIISALLFILSLAGLSKQETAKLGCTSGIVGMVIALIATFVGVTTVAGWLILVVAMVIGAGIGLYLAAKVEMTQLCWSCSSTRWLQQLHRKLPRNCKSARRFS